jgi:uncharacterized membrane protein YqjE
MATQGARQGLFASLQNLSGTLLAMLQTRVELLGNEIEVETLRILRMLMLAQALMFTGAIAALLGVGLLTMWLWELRLGVLAVFCALFLGAAVWSYRALMQMVQRSSSPFDASVAALRDDIQRLRQGSGNATTPD